MITCEWTNSTKWHQLCIVLFVIHVLAISVTVRYLHFLVIVQSCVTPSKPMHGKFKSEPRSKYYFENIVGYQCDSGYSLRGHERTKCLIHGNWSHAAPTCTGTLIVIV